MEKMPPFPVYNAFENPKDYAFALSAYWEARARLAVEALKYLDGFFPDLDDAGTVFIRNTLAAIGELPEVGK